jgi:hypothetical protein
LKQRNGLLMLRPRQIGTVATDFQGVEAVKPIPNTQLTYTTRANDETSGQPVTYQIANINADLLDDLPGSSATIKINDDLGYDVEMQAM